MKLILLAVGKIRGADAELCEEYKKRLSGDITVKELAAGTMKSEGELLLAAIPAKAFVVLCDERGKDLASREFADKFAAWQERGVPLVLVIGGADGVAEPVKVRSDYTLSLGRKTWPHRLARIMLLEQIYRARQINAGHPYHRD